MKYLKDHDGNVFAFESDGSQDSFIPSGLIPMTEAEVLAHLHPTPVITCDALCIRIDQTADNARSTVAGDPLRAVEHERSAAEAQAFAAAGYPTDAVPRTVAAWAINGRSAQQAADSILAEAAAYTEALYRIREIRLQGKELVRTQCEAGNLVLAEQIATKAIADIEAAIIGVGNAQAVLT